MTSRTAQAITPTRQPPTYESANVIRGNPTGMAAFYNTPGGPEGSAATAAAAFTGTMPVQTEGPTGTGTRGGLNDLAVLSVSPQPSDALSDSTYAVKHGTLPKDFYSNGDDKRD